LPHHAQGIGRIAGPESHLWLYECGV
jgi:hypothetical protein